MRRGKRSLIVSGPRSPDQDMANIEYTSIYIHKHRFSSSFNYGDHCFVYGPNHASPNVGIYVLSSLSLSSSTRRFYPHRFSGKVVVIGVVTFLPRYVPSLPSRTGFSVPTARRLFSMLLTISRFPLENNCARKKPWVCALGEN